MEKLKSKRKAAGNDLPLFQCLKFYCFVLDVF